MTYHSKFEGEEIPSPFMRPPMKVNNIGIHVEEKRVPKMVRSLARMMLIVIGAASAYVITFDGVAGVIGNIAFGAWLMASAEAMIESLIIGDRPNRENVLKQAIEQALKETEKIK